MVSVQRAVTGWQIGARRFNWRTRSEKYTLLDEKYTLLDEKYTLLDSWAGQKCPTASINT